MALGGALPCRIPEECLHGAQVAHPVKELVHQGTEDKPRSGCEPAAHGTEDKAGHLSHEDGRVPPTERRL